MLMSMSMAMSIFELENLNEIVRICAECKKFFLFSIGFEVDLVAKRCWRFKCVCICVCVCVPVLCEIICCLVDCLLNKSTPLIAIQSVKVKATTHKTKTRKNERQLSSRNILILRTLHNESRFDKTTPPALHSTLSTLQLTH